MLRRPVFFIATCIVALITFGGCESTGVNFDLLSVDTKAAMDVLPSDAKFVAMVDVHDISENPNLSIGSALVSVESLEGEARAEVEDFLSLTGFDPATDLNNIYVAVGDKEDALVVANAKLDIDRVVEYIDSRADNLTKGTYRDLVTYSFADGEHNGAIGLAGESMVVAGPSIDEVHDALDRVLDGTAGLSSNQLVMDLVGKVGGSDAWFVAAEMPDVASAPDNELEQAMSSIDQVAVGVDSAAEEVAATTFLVPTTGLDADVLADLVKGAVALMKVEAQDEPLAFEVLDDVKVRTTNGDVRVDVVFGNEAFAALTK